MTELLERTPASQKRRPGRGKLTETPSAVRQHPRALDLCRRSSMTRLSTNTPPRVSSVCAEPDCHKPPVARGLCQQHYDWHKYRKTLPPRREPPTLEERLWPRVDVRDAELCWEWLGAKNRGYGSLKVKGRDLQATHVAWFLTHGEWPAGDENVCHTCDNPGCVNPSHLWLGTHSDNMRDMVRKGRHRAPRIQGSDHPNSKLSERDVREMRRRYKRGETQQQLAEAFDVAGSTVHRTVSGQAWKHLAALEAEAGQ